MKVQPLVHYPVRRRWPWQRRRCCCGVRLWRCPDFVQRVTGPLSGSSRARLTRI